MTYDKAALTCAKTAMTYRSRVKYATVTPNILGVMGYGLKMLWKNRSHN